ncbi:hypothetical protein SAMN04487959_12925 [Modicisalibacter xianhensis]|uniref:Uncharacterized protein n=1 Tax=Modicisalibacter xianhensis TaxID=442341 RepID=A0A1I3GC30_9GAMM|nr:hypothetical protein SAMN04487959_12925 [Halomonas xianhensis]
MDPTPPEPGTASLRADATPDADDPYLPLPLWITRATLGKPSPMKWSETTGSIPSRLTQSAASWMRFLKWKAMNR